jgi:hypothetical protein
VINECHEFLARLLLIVAALGISHKVDRSG